MMSSGVFLSLASFCQTHTKSSCADPRLQSFQIK